MDFIENPTELEKGVYCVRSAVYFWHREELYGVADQGDTEVIVDKITAKINLHTDSYEKRREHFKNIREENIFEDAF